MSHKVFSFTEHLQRKITMRFFLKQDILDDWNEAALDDSNNHLKLEDIFLGYNTWKLLHEQSDKGDATPKEQDTFLKAVYVFYREGLADVFFKMNVDTFFWN